MSAKIIDVDFKDKKINFSFEAEKMSHSQRDVYMKKLNTSLETSLEMICKMFPEDEDLQEIFAVEFGLIKKHIDDNNLVWIEKWMK